MQVLLSVVMVTYNHRPYIEEALNGILKQEVNFDFEVIVADDASTDGTQEAVRAHLASWQTKRAKPVCIFRNENIGMQRNVVDAMNAAQGKYIACLDGDDYWIDSQKLQMQVDYLEANPDYYLCAHKTLLRKDSDLYDYEWRLNPFRENYRVRDYISRLFFHTSSIVLRRSNGWPGWTLYIKQLDQAFVILNSQHHADKIRILQRSMSVYRLHAGGVTQSVAHKDKARAGWSHCRLLCGIARECPWVDRSSLLMKLREVLVQMRLDKERALIARLKIYFSNIRCVSRLAVYKYAAGRRGRLQRL